MSDTPDHWFEPIGDRMGRSYLRYAHTKGTVQEVDHLVDALSLRPGERVLDVGCGPGRHANELARRGIGVHGIDISTRFVELARAEAVDGATFERLDARSMTFESEFDAVICLCQGAFGMMTGPADDEAVIAGIATAVAIGGRVALSAFNAYFAVRHHTDATFDADLGVAHERTVVRCDDGTEQEIDLWTGCYTPRELRSLFARHDLAVDSVTAAEPGAYGTLRADVDHAEFLVLAHRS